MERIFTLSAGTPVAAAIAAVITATSSPSFAALPAAGAAVRAGAAAGAAVCTGAGAAAGASAPAFLAFTFASISLTQSRRCCPAHASQNSGNRPRMPDLP